jgi:proline-specific peptidase
MTGSRRSFIAGAFGSLMLGSVLGDTPADGVRWIQLREGYKVWTCRVGPRSTRSAPLKVLLLHGGPGFPHDYMECFADFLPQAGIEIYFYDQLGCGHSDRPDDERLWNLVRYVDEVEQVRAALGLDRFVLFGHSWGSVLTIEYALGPHARHLRAAVISNMTASMRSSKRSKRRASARVNSTARSSCRNSIHDTSAACSHSPNRCKERSTR